MSFTRTALNNTRVTMMIMIVIMILGLVSYNNLSRDSMPPYTIRICTVVTQFPGASPERVEQLITKKIEEVVQELPELDDVNSESRTGLSIVTVSLKPDVPKTGLQSVWDRLRRKVENIENDLPEGSRKPKINDDGFGTVYGVMVGITGDGYNNVELNKYAESIRDDLVRLDDASEVEIKGELPEQIYVEFDNARLAEMGLTSSMLQSFISSTNIVFSGGQVSLGDERITLEPSGNFESIEDLEKTILTLPNGSKLQLGSIAQISRTYKSPAEKLVRINGEEGLAIAVSLKDGANIIRLGEVVDERIDYYNRTLPIGVSLNRMAAQDIYVDQKVTDFLSNVYQSVGIVLLVMLLFLGFRTGFVVASLIPMAMIMTLWLMDLSNIGLNQVSLAALIMALGLLVDNAIVVSEAMMVKMEEGVNAVEAAVSACGELMVPLLVSSLTTSAAFLAFFLAENSMGEMMGPLFVVITLALLSSWILAMTLIPFLGVRFIKVKQKDESTRKQGIFERLNKYYKVLLEKTLNFPVASIIVILLLFIGSLALFGKLPFIFFPDSDRNLVTLDMNLPLGTKIEKTEEVVTTIEEYIQTNLLVNENRTTGINDWSSFIGEGPSSYDLGYQPGEANSGYAHMLLNTTSFLENTRVIEALDKFCLEQFPDARTTVAPLSGGGGGGSDVEVRIAGESPQELYRLSNLIKQKMTDISGSKNVADNWGSKIKKFIIDIDRNKGDRAGLTNQDIAMSLKTTLDGSNAGSFRDGDENIPIIMRNQGSESLDVLELGGVNILAQGSGRSVPLVQVAEIEPDWQYPKILRRNLYRTMTISCDAKEGVTASNITGELLPWLEEEAKSWKDGYSYTLGGESEQSNEAMGAVIAKLPLAGFIILLLLVLQFNSFRKTFMVLSTIPLGLIGVILGLFLFRSYFGFMAFLGLISLAGIVINNAIVLLDRIKIEVEEMGRSEYDAIVAAAQQRFRPILLTTFTTTLGLIPLYLGGGAMWEPMAVAIMVGLLFATVITLLFIPILYKVLFRVKRQTV
ncbi:MAG: efflux RND transporter permease subunit [Saprospiraceae bacterium]|nr:efflux RND transporter permease subunit [Saprospiraceae bacterium]